MKEHRLTGDVVQQDSTRNDDEIGFAEGQIPLVVQPAQCQTRGRVRHLDDRPHALVDRDRGHVVFAHPVFEDPIEQKRLHQKLSLCLQLRARDCQVTVGPRFGVRRSAVSD